MPKLYAVRDRLVDYFMQPFVGPSDKQVLASIATVINGEGNNSAISQTPQHFEIWRLADIDENTGRVSGEKEYLADASSLIRGGIRGGTEAGPGAGKVGAPEGRVPGAAAGPTGHANAGQRAPQEPAQAEAQPGEEADRSS